MEKTPTAEEFALKDGWDKVIDHVTIKRMQEFAKLHVEAQLKAILEKSTIETKCYEFGDMDEYHVINKDSITNAYPLTNIK